MQGPPPKPEETVIDSNGIMFVSKCIQILEDRGKHLIFTIDKKLFKTCVQKHSKKMIFN